MRNRAVRMGLIVELTTILLLLGIYTPAMGSRPMFEDLHYTDSVVNGLDGRSSTEPIHSADQTGEPIAVPLPNAAEAGMMVLAAMGAIKAIRALAAAR